MEPSPPRPLNELMFSLVRIHSAYIKHIDFTSFKMPILHQISHHFVLLDFSVSQFDPAYPLTASLMSWFTSWLGQGSQASADTLELAALPKRVVNLEFLDDLDPKYNTEKPYYSNVPFTETDAPSTNVVSKKSRVTLHDIRGNENLFSLDVHGFELIRHPLGFDQWQDGHKVVRDVYPGIIELLKGQLGEDVRVVVFDHTVRVLPYRV